MAPGLNTVKTGGSACLQDRFGGCIFPHTDPSDSQEYQLFAFQNKVYHFKVLPIGLRTAPQLPTRLEHTVAGDLHRKGILVLPCIDDCLVHYLDKLLNHQLLLLQMAELVGFKQNIKKSEIEPFQDIQFLLFYPSLDQGRAVLLHLKAWEVVKHMHCKTIDSNLSQ